MTSLAIVMVLVCTGWGAEVEERVDDIKRRKGGGR